MRKDKLENLDLVVLKCGSTLVIVSLPSGMGAVSYGNSNYGFKDFDEEEIEMVYRNKSRTSDCNGLYILFNFKTFKELIDSQEFLVVYKYQEPTHKEMTVEQVSKELGYEVKIVKG